ncbi:MAG: hypothetical protein E6Q97_21440 [Desulfurellales bacterium]|nr:MAG: hypothetical protein E6Q97_21440 [Desulfurellales bacterium]
MSLVENLASAIVKQDKAASRDSDREKERLALKPFETKFQVYHKDTINELKGWRPPSGDDAYILFEKKFIERGDTDTNQIKYTLHIMKVGSRPDQLEKLRYNVDVKGMRILHYDRFPKTNDPIASRARLAKMHFNPQENRTAYEALEAAILRHVRDSKSNTAVFSETKKKSDDVLKEKLEARRAKEEKDKEAAQ